MRVEFSPGTAPPTQDAPGLRDAGNRVPQELPLQQAAPGNCFQNIVTKIRAEEGNDCDTYRVEIAGFSERCVKDCDDKARLEELRQAGQKLCFEFCQRKQCKGPTFSPPPECAISECGNNPKCDQNICPNLNACFLLQTRRVWNCVCQEL
jgi:hypothetical protein